MQISRVPGHPWSRVVVLVDYCSDFVEVQEVADATSPTIIQFLKEQFRRHGIPDVIVSDNGSRLVSHGFR